MSLISERVSKKKKKKFKDIRRHPVSYIILCLGAGFSMGPVIWVVLSSLKTNIEFFTNPWSIPLNLNWKNYIDAWFTGNFNIYYFNSVSVVAVTIAVTIPIASLAGFALAQFDLKSKNTLFILLLSGMMIPFQIVLIPLFELVRILNLLNMRWVLVGPYVAFGLPLTTLIMKGFFEQLPAELGDAARIDGCSDFQVFWRIMLPLASPAIGVAAILQTVFSWNEFLFALTFIREETERTVPLGLMAFRGEHSIDCTGLSAGVVLASLPLIIAFILLQKHFVKGVLGGALKG